MTNDMTEAADELADALRDLIDKSSNDADRKWDAAHAALWTYDMAKCATPKPAEVRP